jgi:hypothetical protein
VRRKVVPRNSGQVNRGLFASGDDAASDACGIARRAAFRGMDDDRGSAVAEYGVIVAAHGYVGCNHGDARGVVVANDQEEIRNITGRSAVVGMAPRVKVWTGALEIGWLAFGVLVDMHRVLTRREVSNVELKAHTLGGAGEGRSADGFALSILDVDDHGLAVGGTILRERGCAEARQQYGKGDYRFHDDTPLTEQDRKD